MSKLVLEEIKQEIIDKEYQKCGYDTQQVINNLATKVAINIFNDIRNLKELSIEYKDKEGS